MGSIWVGTSGFSYSEWRGQFYPQDLSKLGFLEYYASRLNSVEIDSTFYRLPRAETLVSWRESTPADFRFTLKASQKITHRERLRVPSETTQHLSRLARSLESRLGLILYQLPPFFRCDLDRLKAFLEVLPSDLDAVIEFRDPSWFVPEVYQLMEKRGVALCILDADDECSPLQLTAARTCIRLRRSSYSEQERDAWRTRWEEWSRSGVEVFAYVKHKENPNAPQIAMEFARGL